MKNHFIGILYAVAFTVIIFNACQSEEELTYARYYINGKGVYETHCENCHGKEGQGLAGLIPPLTDTTFLKVNRDQLACIVKYGLADRITVNGTVYQSKMPAEDHLANIDIAQVITYITNSFGNKQGLYDVDAVAGDLANCK
jgi:mono/diheme cytochrome c family protein